MLTQQVRRYRRKGASGIQLAVVLAAVALVTVVSVQFLGTSTRGELQQTASDVADPASLVNRWGESAPCESPCPQ